MRICLPLATLLLASSLVAACGGHRGPERREPAPVDPAKMEQMYYEFVARWDYNEDGVASCDDMALQRSRLFRLLDTDKDGFLSTGEYRYAQFEDKSFMFYDFLRVDKNSSGTITIEELNEVPHSQFQAADKDHDCTISREEAMMALRDSRAGTWGSREDSPDGERGGRGGRGGPPGGNRGPGGGDSPF